MNLKTETVVSMKNKKLYDRLVAKVRVNPENGCWEWTGYQIKCGHYSGHYGSTTFYDELRGKQRSTTTHRAMMWAIHGPLRRDQIVCHKCDNVLCCNPDHLWIGTDYENQWDSRRKNRHYEGRKTHCERGHPLSGDNIVCYRSSKPGTRICRACQRGRDRMKKGWPEHLAFSLAPIKLGTMINRETGAIEKIPLHEFRKAKRAQSSAKEC